MLDKEQARVYVTETQRQEDAHGRILAEKRGTPLPAHVETVRAVAGDRTRTHVVRLASSIVA